MAAGTDPYWICRVANSLFGGSFFVCWMVWPW